MNSEELATPIPIRASSDISLLLLNTRKDNSEPGPMQCPEPGPMQCPEQHSVGGCHLLRLPADMRNIIYDMVFHAPKGIHVDFDHNRHQYIPQDIFALSSTCKQIYNECKDLPFWLNTFHFHVPVLEEPEQLNRKRRHHHFSTPIVLPLPQAIQSHYRKRNIASKQGDLASANPHLREKAQNFITLAMQLPHIDHLVFRLETIVSQPLTSRLQKVHVHLGSQTRHPFIERFFTAWNEVSPALLALNNLVELQISFEMRISKRLSVAYKFGMQDADKTLEEMDRCVKAQDFTLSELATLNGIRVRIWGAFFGTENAKPPSPFRPEGDLDCTQGTYRNCGIAVIDRIAFGRDMHLQA